MFLKTLIFIEFQYHPQTWIQKIIYVFLKNDKYFLEKKEVAKNLLESDILKLWESKKFKDIVILNDENSEIKTLIYLLDLLKKNKIEKVTFANDIEGQ